MKLISYKLSIILKRSYGSEASSVISAWKDILEQ